MEKVSKRRLNFGEIRDRSQRHHLKAIAREDLNMPGNPSKEDVAEIAHLEAMESLGEIGRLQEARLEELRQKFKVIPNN